MEINQTFGYNRTNPGYGKPTTLANLNEIQILNFIICILSVIFNGFLLWLHASNSTLRTSFSVYLNALSTANIINACLQNPLMTSIKDVITNQQASVWCGFQLLFRSSIVAYISVCHTLICLNRLWAIVQPHSYQRKHTRKKAIIICCTTYAVVVLFILPAVAVDATYPRSPLLNQWCLFNLNIYAVKQWNSAFNMIFMVVPELVIVAACPWILCKRRKQQQVRTTMTAATATTSSKDGGQHGTVISGTALANTRKRSEQSAQILIVLTISVVVCWTPLNAYYLTTSLQVNQLLFRTANVLKMLHSTLDPLLFIAAIDDLRKAFTGCFSLNFSRASVRTSK